MTYTAGIAANLAGDNMVSIGVAIAVQVALLPFFAWSMKFQILTAMRKYLLVGLGMYRYSLHLVGLAVPAASSSAYVP